MPGYDLSRFPNLSEMEKSEYTCSICQDIFCSPMTTPCCLQTFCEDCITGWLQNNNTCPYDRTSLSLDKLTRAPRVLANMLGNLNIKCDFWDKGCRKVVKLEDLIQHTAICEHNEANRLKTCDVCYCDKTRDHDCVEALLEAKCSANDEIDLLKRTVKELKSEKDHFLKSIQDISSGQGNTTITDENRQLRMDNDTLRTDLDNLLARYQLLEQSGLFTDSDEKFSLLKMVLEMMVTDNILIKQLVGAHILTKLSFNKTLKRLSPSINAMVKYLDIIDERILTVTSDTVLESIWAVMWNITDESVANCQQFMDNRGMARFTLCMDLFTNDKELIDNMLGMLSNVAECDMLKTQLLAKDYVKRFVKLLSKENYGYLISCKAAAILTNLAIIGNDRWQRDITSDCQRNIVLGKINTEINGWLINSEMRSNYNTMRPITRLLKSNIPSDCYIWPVWRLANCTRVNSSKYCSLLRTENGLQVLDDLIKRSEVTRTVKLYALLILYHCDLATSDPDKMKRLESSDSMVVPAEFLRRKSIKI